MTLPQLGYRCDRGPLPCSGSSAGCAVTQGPKTLVPRSCPTSTRSQTVRTEGEKPARYRPLPQREEQMSNLVVFMNLTLDGVMQAPGRPDEDRRGGFSHGGWASVQIRNPDADPVLASAAAAGMANTGALRWGDAPTGTSTAIDPTRPTTPSPRCSTTPRSMSPPRPWPSRSHGPTPPSCPATPPRPWAKLKQQPGKDLVVLGSGELVQSLMRRNLIDRYVLLIHPAGARFGAAAVPRRRGVRRAAAGRCHGDHDRRAGRDLPAGPTDAGTSTQVQSWSARSGAR
jgi:hypothetical protein